MSKKPVQLDENGKRKFGMRDCLAYAAGDLGCNMSFALKSTMAIFWTQFMQLDLWYSMLLIIVQVWDAINDALIGSMVDADKRQYKRNKFLQYIWVGSIGLIVGGACCFLPFPNAPVWAKMIIFIAGYVVWDAFYTVANVPYGSLLSLISSKPADRASLSAWRSVGSIGGNMIPMMILPFIIYDAENNLIGERVFIAALIMGVLGFFCFQYMIKNTEIREETEVKLDDSQKFNVIEAMGNFIKNRPAVGATLAAMGMFVGMQGAATAVTVLFQSYFHNVQFSGIVSMFSMLPIIFFTPPGPQDGHQVRQEGTGHLRCDLLHDRLRPYVRAAHDARHERRADLPGLPADQLPGHGHLLHRVLGHDGRRHRLQRVEDRQARGRHRVCAAFLLP